MWGTHQPGQWGHCLPPLIPTGVGNTPVSSPVFSTAWAHPHGCGEHRADSRHPPSQPAHPHGCGEHQHAERRSKYSQGSSPRVWGTRRTGRPRNRTVRLIPTGVGNTGPFSGSGYTTQAHPHGCGEHRMRVSMMTVGVGSSPRVWGTLPGFGYGHCW